MRIRKNNHSWLTSEVVDQIQIKNHYFKQTKQNARDVNLWTFYQNQKQMVNRLIKHEKRNKIQRTMDINKANTREFCSEIKGLPVTKKMIDESIKAIQNRDGDIFQNNIAAANYINEYHANIGENLANLINSPEWSSYQHFGKTVSSFDFSLQVEAGSLCGCGGSWSQNFDLGVSYVFVI